MTYLIDRRLQGKNKSAINRERFLRRYKSQIKDAVGRAIKGRSITDIENGEKVSIPVKDVNEPNFGHAHGGVWETVNPGNKEYQKGDQFNRPRSGGEAKDAALFPGKGPDTLFACIGHLGQYVIVSPDQGLVVVRLGKTNDPALGPVRDALGDLVAAFQLPKG